MEQLADLDQDRVLGGGHHGAGFGFVLLRIEPFNHAGAVRTLLVWADQDPGVGDEDDAIPGNDGEERGAPPGLLDDSSRRLEIGFHRLAAGDRLRHAADVLIGQP